MEKQIEEKVIAFRRFQDDADRELARRPGTRPSTQIEQQVLPLINQVGSEGGYTVIFNKFQSGLIFADDAVDITDEIIQRFDGAAAPARRASNRGAPARRAGRRWSAARCAGTASWTVEDIRTLDAAGPADLSFLHQSALPRAGRCESRRRRAGGPRDVDLGERDAAGGRRDPSYALALLLGLFHPRGAAPRRESIRRRSWGRDCVDRSGRARRRLRRGRATAAASARAPPSMPLAVVGADCAVGGARGAASARRALRRHRGRRRAACVHAGVGAGRRRLRLRHARRRAPQGAAGRPAS